MKRRLQARQVTIFPALVVVDADDETGRTTLYPLPVGSKWRLVLMWLLFLLRGRLDTMRAGLVNKLDEPRQRLARHRWLVRLGLELNVAFILGRQLGLAALGR
jgi:hypothetical protein